MKKPISVFSFSIQNATNGSTDIHIDGDVVDASTQAMMEAWFGDTTSTSYKSFRNALEQRDSPVYNVYINSPGGHVGDAMAIHDYLVELQNKGKVVNTIGRGIVASSATLILLAGKSPEMSANSWFMMHTVSGGLYGTVDQVENYAITMRKFNNSIRDLYALKSSLRKEDVSKLMDAETWLSASEAKDKGLIANVSADASFTNHISKEQWEYANTAVLNSYNNSVKPTGNSNTEEMKQLFADFKNTLMTAILGLKVVDNKIDNTELSNALGSAFTDLGVQLETEVSNSLKNTLGTAEGKALIEGIVNTAVTAATKDLKDEVAELTTQIENKIGKQSQSNPENKVVTPVGGFN